MDNFWEKRIDELNFEPDNYVVSIWVKNYSSTTFDLFESKNPSEDIINIINKEVSKTLLTKLPESWQKQIDPKKSSTTDFILGRNQSIEIKFLNLEELGKIYHSPFQKSIKTEGDMYVIDRETLKLLCKRAVAKHVFSIIKYNGGQHPLIPGEQALNQLAENAGQIYDSYMAIPKGSLIFTKGHNKDFYEILIARKMDNKLLWNAKSLSWNDFGYVIDANDQEVHTLDKYMLIHTDKYKGENRFIANYRDGFYLTNNSVIIDKSHEQEIWQHVINLTRLPKQIYVTAFPGFIPPEMTQPDKDIPDKWLPTKAEFLEVAKNYLEIR